MNRILNNLRQSKAFSKENKISYIKAVAMMAIFTFVFLGAEYMYVNMISLSVSGSKAVMAQNYALGISALGFLLYPAFCRHCKDNIYTVCNVFITTASVLSIFFICRHLSYNVTFAFGLLLFLLLGIFGSAVFYKSMCLLENDRYLARLVGISYMIGILLQFVNNNIIHSEMIEAVILSAFLTLLVALLIKSKPMGENASSQGNEEVRENFKEIPKSTVLGLLLILLVVLMTCIFSTLDNAVTLSHAAGTMDIGQWPRIFLAFSGLIAGFVFDINNRKFMNHIMYCVMLLSTVCIAVFEFSGPFLTGLIIFYMSAGFFAVFFTSSFMELARYTKIPKLWAGIGRAVNNITAAVITGGSLALLSSGNSIAIITIMLILFVAVSIVIAIYTYGSKYIKKKGRFFMKLKKIICTAITGIMLVTAAYLPSYAYNREYCDTFNENSDTLVTDDMEVFYEKEGDINSLLYTVREDGTAMITGWAGKFYAEGAEFEINIPSNIKGHTVTAIADEALSDGYAKIVGVSVPSTVKVIGVHAIDARYLKYLNLSEGLEVIKTAGINCGDNLTSIKIPDSVKYMGGEAIEGKALTDIKLPSDLKYLGKNITSATAYSTDEGNRDGDILYNGQYLLSGYNYAYLSYDDGNSDPSAQTQTKFTYLWGPTENAVIREGTTMMCEESFNFSTIKTVSIPSTLKEIPYLGFYSCKNLDNVVIPGNVKTIGDCAFSLDESLSNLTISEGVEKIGEMAFFCCNNLNEVTIPRSVTEIGMQAFGWDYVNDYDVRNENLVIKCYSGTAAEQYAKDNGFKCILLDTGETIEKGEPTAAADSRAVCEEKGENCAVRKFKDLQDANSDENHWGIEYCLDNGIMNGTGADTFSPDDTITRGQFATMFYRLAGSPEASGNSKFTDLTQDWYKKAVSWAAANGIINGTSDTTFSPDATVTHEQIATIFYRYAERCGLDMTFSEGWDLSSGSYSISDYAIKPMSWCFDRGIMQRYWEILSAPQHAPSRADTAFMFRNFAYELEMN